ANGDDQLVGFQLLLGACSVYVVDSDLFGRLLDLANFHAHIDLQTLLGESFQGFLGHVAIHGGQELGSAFQNGHFGTQTTPHATQFQTNHTGTDNGQLLGNLGQTQCAVVGQNLLFVELGTGQGTSRATGRDNDVLGNQLFGVGTSHIHRPASVNLGAKRSGAVEEVNFVLLEQVQDTVVVLLDDHIFAADQLVQVQRYALDVHAVLGQMQIGVLEVFGRLQQGLGRNATNVGACTARSGFAFSGGPCVHASDAHTQLSGTNGGDVATGACTNHDNIKLLSHKKSHKCEKARWTVQKSDGKKSGGEHQPPGP